MASSGEQLNGNNQHSVFQMASILQPVTTLLLPPKIKKRPRKCTNVAENRGLFCISGPKRLVTTPSNPEER